MIIVSSFLENTLGFRASKKDLKPLTYVPTMLQNADPRVIVSDRSARKYYLIRLSDNVLTQIKGLYRVTFFFFVYQGIL